MKIPLFQPSTINDLAIDHNDIEEKSYSSEDTSCLEIPDDPLNNMEWLVNSEEIATELMNYLFETPINDKTKGSLSGKFDENKKIDSIPNTPSTPIMSCLTSLSHQESNMEMQHKPGNVINGIRDLSKDSTTRKHKRKHTSHLGGQKYCLNVRWSNKKKRNSNYQKRIWSLETPVWILKDQSRENNKNLTKDEANKVQPNASISTETEHLVSQTCSHCGTKKTPQWRRGPKGPGTLCNACGIRYRNGSIEPKRHRSKRRGATTEPTENK